MKRKIIIGISASIAAHKMTSLVEMLTEKYNVQVVLSANAKQFVSPITLEALSKNKVLSETFEGDHTIVHHVSAVAESDLVVIVPASASTIGKYANGIGNDILSTVLLVADPNKVLIAPAMNDAMYLNPIVQANINRLKQFGVKEIMPIEAKLANGKCGIGCLPPLAQIAKEIDNRLNDAH